MESQKVLQDVYTRLQEVAGGYKMLQGVTRGPVIIGCYKSEEVTGGYKVLHEVTVLLIFETNIQHASTTILVEQVTVNLSFACHGC